MSVLFEPVQLSSFQLKNKIFMAPMSRNRADGDGVLPDYAVEYYRQRASAGLIIAEATLINDWGGAMKAPGIYSDAQINQWKKITDAVHQEGSRIFLQLWHTGRASHQSLMPDGRIVKGPSAIPLEGDVFTFEGWQKASIPEALEEEDLQELRKDYQQACKNALKAGFDGVEIHAANGYLLDQFLRNSANQRDDQYGGSIKNRIRFVMEIVSLAIEAIGADKVGIRFSPTGTFNGMHDSDPLALYSALLDELNDLNIAYLHLVEKMSESEMTEEKNAIIGSLVKRWQGAYIANGGFTQASGEAYIQSGDATAIAYGRPWISNPDLVERFKRDMPLVEPDETTFYTGDEKGYIDYPSL